jgi:putative phosphoribosyl transferase
MASIATSTRLDQTRLDQTRLDQSVHIDTQAGLLPGMLTLPEAARGVVLFAHGSGSGRLSPRNRFVAKVLNQAAVGTLLFDLLTAEEERIDAVTAHLRFDIPLLAERLDWATDWAAHQESVRHLPLGYFGASTGAAAALIAAASRSDIAAVVSRGGRPDLAGAALPKVQAATALFVGQLDQQVLELNEFAYRQLRRCRHKELRIIPGATHLFEEPGTLEQVAHLAAEWFARFLQADARQEKESHG